MSSNNEHWFKWVVIGFLSAIGLVGIVVCILVYIFTPLIKVDETTGRVQLFGGAIDVQAKNVITSLSKNNSFVFGSIEGAEILPADIQTIFIKFGTGEVRVDYNNSREINWDCDGAGKNARLASASDPTSVILDFSAAFVDCDITLPVMPIRIDGNTGEIDVRKIKADVDIKLGQGNVLLEPVAENFYAYDLKTASGNVDPELKSAPSDPAKPLPGIKVKVEVKVGDIQHLD